MRNIKAERSEAWITASKSLTSLTPHCLIDTLFSKTYGIGVYRIDKDQGAILTCQGCEDTFQIW